MTSPFELAGRMDGIAETPGDADTPLIQAMLARYLPGHPHDETAWCGAFVGFVCWLLGLPEPLPPLSGASARAWLTVGTPVPTNEALIGYELVVLARGDGAQPGPEVIAAPGHVGWFAGWSRSGGDILIRGGNQGNRVSTMAFPGERILGIRDLRPPS